MAFGLPVLSNISDQNRTRAFRRYSYLNECPILSSTPETILENLKVLICNPELRKELGIASRMYVEKYHSYSTIQYVFPKIYENIWLGKNNDLLNMFHPLNKDGYNVKTPYINHPLFENSIKKKN